VVYAMSFVIVCLLFEIEPVAVQGFTS
jgi:hypothetical protein